MQFPAHQKKLLARDRRHIQSPVTMDARQSGNPFSTRLCPLKLTCARSDQGIPAQIPHKSDSVLASISSCSTTLPWQFLLTGSVQGFVKGVYNKLACSLVSTWTAFSPSFGAYQKDAFISAPYTNQQCANGCIVKRKAQRSPLFWPFSAGLDFLRCASSARIPVQDSLNCKPGRQGQESNQLICPKVLWRGRKRSLRTKEQKAGCTGATRGCTGANLVCPGASDFWETLDPSVQKTFCTPARQLSVICTDLTLVHGALVCNP